ncbi:MAG: tRNA pseudouridine(38-40) synthase TruA [Bacteroidetes bacterium]|nr:tRNA pseudouridine(38-40) synthase TruA [Bacteroidota bacterium]
MNKLSANDNLSGIKNTDNKNCGIQEYESIAYIWNMTEPNKRILPAETLLLRIEYDGTRYAGWQYQENARSVQEVLQNALQKISGLSLPVIGAGRTDSGVHARGQIAHIELPKPLGIPENKIPIAFNTRLPKDIRITGGQYFQRPIHARFDACAREYSYLMSKTDSIFGRHFRWFMPFPYDSDALFESAAIFLGKHDFTTFSKRNDDTPRYDCNVEICRWSRIDENTVRLQIKSDRFVYGMVRALTGVMLEIARKRRTFDEVKRALAACDRTLCSPLAAAEGLTLEAIYYPSAFGVSL